MMAETRDPLQAEAVHEYWLRNRVRFDTWNEKFAQVIPALESPLNSQRLAAWKRAGELMTEILMAEPLARISSSIAMRLEDRLVDGDSHAILHSVYTTHLDLRKRSLKWILEGIDAGVSEAHELNRLRSYLEHWSDMLLGFFAGPEACERYAFCNQRVAEFSEEYGHRSLGDASETVWSLLLAGNRHWIRKHVSVEIQHPSLSRDVIQAALGMVHPTWFDSLGLLPSRAAQKVTHGLHLVDRTLESLVDGSWIKHSWIQPKHASPAKSSGRGLFE
jgi:hypothetical protein